MGEEASLSGSDSSRLSAASTAVSTAASSSTRPMSSRARHYLADKEFFEGIERQRKEMRDAGRKPSPTADHMVRQREHQASVERARARERAYTTPFFRAQLHMA